MSPVIFAPFRRTLSNLFINANRNSRTRQAHRTQSRVSIKTRSVKWLAALCLVFGLGFMNSDAHAGTFNTPYKVLYGAVVIESQSLDGLIEDVRQTLEEGYNSQNSGNYCYAYIDDYYSQYVYPDKITNHAVLGSVGGVATIYYKYKDASGTACTGGTTLQFYISHYAGVISGLARQEKNIGRSCIGCGAGNPGVGNPVNAGTGNKIQIETDYIDPKGQLSIVRNYNSQLPRGTITRIGNGWMAGFRKRLIVLNDVVIVRREDGQGIPFLLSGSQWTAEGKTRFALSKPTTSYYMPDGYYVQGNSRYVLTHKSGEIEIYDSVYGKLLREYDVNGRALAYTYGYYTYDYPTKITDPNGRALIFGYEYSNTARIKTITLSDGGVITYTYAAWTDHRLTRVTYPDGTSKIYHYENATFPNHLTGITLDDGVGTVTRYATYKYDANGKAISTEHATTDNGAPQEKVTLSYPTASQTVITYANGASETRVYDENLGLKRLLSRTHSADNKTITQTFDASNNRTCVQDYEGRVTTYSYNATNQMVSKTEGQGGTCAAPTSTAETRTTSYEYLSPTLNLVRFIRRASVVSAQQAVTEYQYGDAAHPNLPTVIIKSGFKPDGTPVSRTTTISYNASGQVATIDGPRTDVTDVTTITYNECTTGGGCGRPASITSATGEITSFTSYDAAGRLLSMTGPNGLVTAYVYDTRGRVTSITETPAGGTARTTIYTYDALTGKLATATTPDGITLTYSYDAALYLKTITDNLGNTISYSYDIEGNRTGTEVRDASSTLVRQVTLAYDLRNRVAQINAGGSVTAYVRDAAGNLLQETDPNNNGVPSPVHTTHQYDALDRATQTTDRAGGVSQYAYDTAGRIISFTAANGVVTTYSYDDLGNRLTETSPDRGTLVYTHDAAGNIASIMDARGITIAYSYDAAGRLLLADAPGAANDQSYTIGNTTTSCTNGVGRVCQITDSSGTSAYTYDGFGNIASHTRTQSSVDYVTIYTYDAADRISSITYTGGRVVTYTRDSLGRVLSVSATVGGVPTTITSSRTYRADGLLVGQSFGNGLTETRTYNLKGELTAQTLSGIDSRIYTYDLNGNRTNLSVSGLGYGASFDALDRLVGETLPVIGSTTIGYDANANRTAATGGGGSASYSYTTGTNRITALTGTDPITGLPVSESLGYDAAGNPTSRTGATSDIFAYDAQGRLASITRNGVTLATYTYNSRNLRTSKTTAAGTVLYHYDQNGNLIQESNTAGTVLVSYVWVDGTPLAQITSTGGTDTPVFIHTDHLATPRLATNTGGLPAWSWDSDGFGAVPANGDPLNTGTTTTVNLRFPGQYYDLETGLHYNWNRYYDPRTGRYITSDPIGLEGGANTYGYVDGNPGRWFDPEGLIGIGGYDPSHLLWREADSMVRAATGRRISEIEKALARRQEKFRRWYQKCFLPEFRRNRFAGAEYLSPFEVPWGAAGAAASEGTFRYLEATARNRAIGGFESQRLTRSSIYIKGYRPEYFRAAKLARGAGVAFSIPTLFYGGADAGTAIYSFYTAYKYCTCEK